MSILTQEQFLRDVAAHAMKIVREDDVYRHIRFQRPGTMCMHFDLVTWPGYLCYTGDMGTYVFTRVRDMFSFFRRSEKENLFGIDLHYWAEKIEAGDRRGRGNGVKEFSKAKFDANVREWVEDFIKSDTDQPDEDADAGERALHACAVKDLREAVEREVIGADDNDIRSFDAAQDFSFGAEDSEAWNAHFGAERTFEFTDFWEVDHDEYTHRFQWCCFALAWAIKQFDDAKAASAPAVDAEVPA